jgi:hypothetical protein
MFHNENEQPFKKHNTNTALLNTGVCEVAAEAMVTRKLVEESVRGVFVASGMSSVWFGPTPVFVCRKNKGNRKASLLVCVSGYFRIY